MVEVTIIGDERDFMMKLIKEKVFQSSIDFEFVVFLKTFIGV